MTHRRQHLHLPIPCATPDCPCLHLSFVHDFLYVQPASQQQVFFCSSSIPQRRATNRINDDVNGRKFICPAAGEFSSLIRRVFNGLVFIFHASSFSLAILVGGRGTCAVNYLSVLLSNRQPSHRRRSHLESMAS